MLLRIACVFPCVVLLSAIPATAAETADVDFPAELVDFAPYAGNPVFGGTGKDTWDRQIRERGYILKEGDLWRLWYTGYNDEPTDAHHTDARYLGYATSPDGLKWTRYSDKPILDTVWTEDVHITRLEDRSYRMFAEGRDDIMHWLTSKDGIQWQEQGNVDIRYVDGKPLTPGPYGTPFVWGEKGKWYLFYERNDLGIWLAASTDGKTWVNVQDAPVISIGAEPYDKHAIALNQIVKIGDKYYAYYHGNADARYKAPWTTSVAMSTDLIHWKKYAKNPIIPTEHSSAILVNDGRQYRMYTMHPDVWVWFPRSKASESGGAR
jgi:beta-1,2-mannobiose phosphorylase / 1,2-beta-oligomannan phosphorylase